MADDPGEQDVADEALRKKREATTNIIIGCVLTCVVLIAIVVLVGVARGDIDPTSTVGILAGLATGLVSSLLFKGGGEK